MPARFRKPVLSVLAVAALCLTLQSCALNSKDAKTSKETAYRIIDAATLQAKIDSDAANITVVDARTPEEYADVHIPGAINVPVTQFDAYAHLLPADMNRTVIFYCNGVKCGKSKRDALKAHAMGYTHIQVFADGMPVWEEMGFPIITGPNYEKPIETTKISPHALHALLASGRTDFTVVDVREHSEYAQGHIPGAINIPLETFASRSGELDKKKTIIVYCNSGSRSYKAYRKLMRLGYKKHKQALFADWKAAGYGVAR